jgi:hypothetical protein
MGYPLKLNIGSGLVIVRSQFSEIHFISAHPRYSNMELEC